MFCLKFVWPCATPTKNLPFIKNWGMVSYQLIYFCQAMNKKSLAIASILALLLFGNPRNVAAQDNWTYQRALDYALTHNLTVQQSVLQKRLAELTLKQNQMARLPTLGAGASGEYRFGRNISFESNTYVNTANFSSGVSLSTGADLFGWFTKQNAVAASKYQVYASNFLLEKARNDMGVNVANAFLQILLANEQVKISKSQVDLSMAQLENTKKLVAAGSVPESNQADLEAQLARDSSTLVAAQNTSVINVLQMKALLNLDFAVPFVVELPENIERIPVLNLWETAPEMVYSAALATYPQYRADSMNVKAANKTLASAKGALYPNLSFSAGLNTSYANTIKEGYGPITTGTQTIGYLKNDPTSLVEQPTVSQARRIVPFGDQFSNNFGQNVGLSLSIPIFNGWRLRGNVDRARIDVQDKQLILDINRQKLRQEVYTAHANAVGAFQKYQAAITTERASQKAYDFATKRFNVGLMNTVEYITTQTNLFKAQIDKVSALYDYIFKIKLLEFYRDQRITL